MVGLRKKVGEQPKIVSFFQVNRCEKRGEGKGMKQERNDLDECVKCKDEKWEEKRKELKRFRDETEMNSIHNAKESKPTHEMIHSNPSNETFHSNPSNETFHSNDSSDAKESIHSQASQTSCDASSEWSCDRCTFRNQSNAKFCTVCGHSRARYAQSEAMIDALFKGKKTRTIPRCTVHGLPCVRHQVQKEGKNKGRFFYVCSLPIGFRGDPKAKCNYFKWEDSYLVCS